MFELINVESLVTVLGGNGKGNGTGTGTAPPTARKPTTDGKPTWDEIGAEMGRFLDRMIAARPFEKICRESGNCYREPESGL